MLGLSCRWDDDDDDDADADGLAANNRKETSQECTCLRFYLPYIYLTCFINVSAEKNKVSVSWSHPFPQRFGVSPGSSLQV